MFDLDKAIAAWRRSLQHRRALLDEDLDELERHLRDHVAALASTGRSQSEAFEQALQEIGGHSAVESEYRKVYWGKIRRRGQIAEEIRWRLGMAAHFLKIAGRTLWRYKGYTALNLTGLSVGIACCLLIAVYVIHEAGYDRYHEKANRIYRVVMHGQEASYGGEFGGIAEVPAPWGPALTERIAAVEKMVRFRFVPDVLMRSAGAEAGDADAERPGDRAAQNPPGVRAYEDGGLYVDEHVFDVFSFDVLRGDPQTALRRPGSVVLTKTLAERYFGGIDVVGQQVVVDEREAWTVTGVMEDVPGQSSLTFDFLVSMSSFDAERLEDWYFNQFYTYVLLRHDASPEDVAKTFEASLDIYDHREIERLRTPHLQPLTSIYLRSDLFREGGPRGSAARLRVFGIVALFILGVACINFTNLATARSARRAKEIGIRKVSGAHRGMLILQFLGESSLLSLFAAVLGIGLAALALPLFNRAAAKSFTVGVFTSTDILVGLVVGGVIVGLLAGSYPAFVLSGFRPVRVFKDRFLAGGAAFRRVLIVFQFAVAGFLIAATGIVYQQMRYVESKDLGFSTDQIIVVPLRSDENRRDYERIKQRLGGHPDILNVTASGNLLGGGDWGIPFVLEGIPKDDVPSMRAMVVDHDFIDTYDLYIARGRGFSRDFSSDTTAYLLNETAAARIGWDDPLGKNISMPPIGRSEGPVIGIVEDFHFRSLHDRIEPIMFFIPQPDWFAFISVEARAGSIPQVLDFLETEWREVAPQDPFTYTFMDEQFAQLYEADRRTGTLLAGFTGLAVVIACLGLFGLAAFTAEQRRKEIGIRKVLGASAARIVAMLSKDFVQLVLVALIIAMPLAYLAMRRWLEDFAYRIEVGVDVFAVGALIALGVALVTVSYQALRAAHLNPAITLRQE